MKILIIRNTVCDGRVVEIGEVVDTDDRIGRSLIAAHKAVEAIDAPVIEAAVAAPTAEAAVVEPARGARGRRAKK